MSLNREDGRRRIEQEDNLINHRVSWLIGSQSFLLTAFVLLRNSPGYYPGGQMTLTPEYMGRTALLVYVLVLVGFLIALCSSIGVFAAFMAISSWRRKVAAEERQYLTSDASLAHLGGLAAVLPGPVLASVWVMLFCAEWPSVRQHVQTSYLWVPIITAAGAFVFWVVYTFLTYVRTEPG